MVRTKIEKEESMKRIMKTNSSASRMADIKAAYAAGVITNSMYEDLLDEERKADESNKIRYGLLALFFLLVGGIFIAGMI